jgi:hypothetical protein
MVEQDVRHGLIPELFRGRSPQPAAPRDIRGQMSAPIETVAVLALTYRTLRGNEAAVLCADGTGALAYLVGRVATGAVGSHAGRARRLVRERATAKDAAVPRPRLAVRLDADALSFERVGQAHARSPTIRRVHAAPNKPCRPCRRLASVRGLGQSWQRMARTRRTSSAPLASRRRQGVRDAPVRGYGALIQAGAAAAAVASIVGVTVTLLDLWPDGRPPPKPIVELGVPKVSGLMTYKRYAGLRRWKTKTLPQEDLLLKGVKVDYQAKVSGASPQTIFPTRMTLLKSGSEELIKLDGESFRTTQDPDKGVLHKFIYSRGAGLYKLIIEAPEPSGSSSFDEKESRWFRFRPEEP